DQRHQARAPGARPPVHGPPRAHRGDQAPPLRPAREDPRDLARTRPCQRRGHLEEALPAAQLGSDGRERDLRAPRAPAPRGQRREPPRRREADLHAVASPMRKLVYLVASTLDGFIAGPDGSYGFFPFSADSELARHLRSEYPETLPTALRKALGFDDAPNRVFDTVVMGRGTYEPGRRGRRPAA